MRCFNGYLSVGEALERLNLRLPNLAPLWDMLSSLSEAGLIVGGPADPYRKAGDKHVMASPAHVMASPTHVCVE
jgi:hypothetical protein